MVSVLAEEFGYQAARHEGGAMAMADAYFRATGEVAVCTTTHGAGLANTATALGEAVNHRSSVLVICGDAPTGGARPFDLDTAGFATALGARAVRVTAPDTARHTARHALALARDGAGPVLLCLPADLLSATVADAPEVSVASEPVHLPARLPADLDSVVGMLASARRPLVLAGLGAWRSGAAKMLQEPGHANRRSAGDHRHGQRPVRHHPVVGRGLRRLRVTGSGEARAGRPGPGLRRLAR